MDVKDHEVDHQDEEEKAEPAFSAAVDALRCVDRFLEAAPVRVSSLRAVLADFFKPEDQDRRDEKC